jgi:protein phosphatase 1 regulatory subunit 37
VCLHTQIQTSLTLFQIQSLRTAFTLNTALKRLFLSDTQLTSLGAIALAEFLPESASLLHLDLTRNELGLAGMMALSGGLKANWVMRCLDVDVPFGDEEFAR